MKLIITQNTDVLIADKVLYVSKTKIDNFVYFEIVMLDSVKFIYKKDIDFQSTTAQRQQIYNIVETKRQELVDFLVSADTRFSLIDEIEV